MESEQMGALSGVSNAMTIQGWMEVRFPVLGDRVMAWHGSYLYAALSKQLPSLHQTDKAHWSQIQNNMTTKSHWISLHPRNKAFWTIRCAPELLGDVLRLQDTSLRVGTCTVELKNAFVKPLEPHRFLDCPVVILASSKRARKGQRGGLKSVRDFRVEVERQLQVLGGAGSVKVGEKTCLSIKLSKRHGGRGNHIADGYQVSLDLSDEQSSLLVQAYGLGGRRSYGAGFFASNFKSSVG